MYSEPIVQIPLKEYQDLKNAAGPSVYQKALSEIVAHISKISAERGIVGGYYLMDEVSSILNRNGINTKTTP